MENWTHVEQICKSHESKHVLLILLQVTQTFWER